MDGFTGMDVLFEREGSCMTERQKAIVKAAIELFDENGYAATSTREIARRASVAEGTIFKHYATKKELMISITEMVVRSVLIPLVNSGLNDILQSSYDSLDAFVESLVDNRMRMAPEGVPILRFVLQEMPFHPEIRRLIVKNIKSLPFEEKICQMQEKGLIRRMPPEMAVKLVISCLIGFFVEKYLLLPDLFDEDQEEDVRALTEFIIYGLSERQV